MIAARIVPLRPLPVLGEMNSDDQRGAARVIHNVIDVECDRCCARTPTVINPADPS